MDSEGVDSNGQGLGVDLGKLLAAGIVFVIVLKHLLANLLGSGAVDFKNFLRVGIISIKTSELAL